MLNKCTLRYAEDRLVHVFRIDPSLMSNCVVPLATCRRAFVIPYALRYGDSLCITFADGFGESWNYRTTYAEAVVTCLLCACAR